jgi:hypothetical protein
VVLRVAINTQKFSSLDGFPNFWGLSDGRIPQPVMEITIKELEVEPLTRRTFIFTLEAFPSFIEQLWNQAMVCNFYNSMMFELLLFNKAPSRRTLLNNQIVKFFDQIQGFRVLIFLGDIETKVARHLTECMTLGQHLQDMCAKMSDLFSRGEDCFKRKDYTLASRYWEQLHSFWIYRYHLFLITLTPALRTRYSVKDFMEATLTIELKRDLGKRMIELHSKQYKHALNHAQNSLRAVEKLINRYSLNYRVPEVLQAQFWICQSVGQLALGEKQNSSHSHDMAVSTLCQDPRFSGKSLEVSGWLKGARDRYLEVQCRDRENRTSMAEAHAKPGGLRSLGAWLGLSE